MAILVKLLLILTLILVSLNLYIYLRLPNSSSPDSSSPDSSPDSSSPNSSSNIMKVPNNKRNLVMAVTGNVTNLIENFEKDDFQTKLKYLNDFVVISRNILGNEMPVLCYNLNNITENDITSKGSKIINDLLFKTYRKAIDNNNYNDIAAITISLYKYEGNFSWLASIVENDENGNPKIIKIDKRIVGGRNDNDATPSNFIKFAESADIMNILDYFNKDSNDYKMAKILYDDLINNNNDPMPLEDFGKLYALFGLLLLKQKEDPNRTWIGFKQLQSPSLNYKDSYLPCDN